MTPPSTEAGNAGVVVRPPFLYGGGFIVVLVLRWLWPMPIVGHGSPLWAALALSILGVAIVVLAARTLRAAGTNVDPMRPTTAIVTAGPYRCSRNPIYVGLTLLYLGLASAFNTWWTVIVLVPILAIMHLGVVRREERYLEQKFGEPYRQFCSRVRRYL
jgi:protein-S-isoprenylcysteine O-methyltransferase Ste14